jgi:hypothetical protein
MMQANRRYYLSSLRPDAGAEHAWWRWPTEPNMTTFLG